MLELGALYGRSTVCMAQTARSVVSVDWHQGCKETGRLDSLPVFHDNVKGYTNVIPIITRFETAAELLKGNQFDLIFVDGQHDYASVQQDLAIARQFGGQIVVHDWNNFEITPAATDAGFRPSKVVGSLAILEYVGKDIGSVQSAALENAQWQ